MSGKYYTATDRNVVNDTEIKSQLLYTLLVHWAAENHRIIYIPFYISKPAIAKYISTDTVNLNSLIRDKI